jgi:acetyl-CoA synthetase
MIQIKTIEEYHLAYQKSKDQPDLFWDEIASEFTWKKKWTKVMESDFLKGNSVWFKEAKLNITDNCIDRHLAHNGNDIAIVWEPNNPSESGISLTYNELSLKVNQAAAILKKNGVKKGDRVCLYMGMVPELSIAMLACARIGAIHSVIFGGFSAQSIADRLMDAQASVIITCDGAFRGDKVIPLKSVVDDALESYRNINKVIVVARTHTPVSMIKGRDVWWLDEMQELEKEGIVYVEPEVMDAEDPLFILYTSGSTGKPKGVVHSTAGYMVWAHYTFVNVFQYKANYKHFCTADIGWITGHSYIVYGPLSAGATTVIFEGVPTWPDAGRLWDVVEKYQIDILYTAPTAIRTLMGAGLSFLENKNLSSLKILGSVGEPINEEAWHWLNVNVGKERCPIVDTWWQTETGGILISNLAGVTPSKPSFATLPLPGVFPVLLDENGREITDHNVTGHLCMKQSWPGIIRTTYNNHQRCIEAYFSTHKGYYFTGDGSFRDENGNYRITGRVDDVLNVSGHRIGTAELENAINSHAGVIESAVVAFPHPIKGQGIYAFVVVEDSQFTQEHSPLDIVATVSRLIGPIAKPDKIQIVKALPKTRSGKIMRRILRKIAEGELDSIGDTSTLLDPKVVEEIIQNAV